MHLQKQDRRVFFVCVETTCAEQEKQQESLCSLIQKQPVTLIAASSAFLVLAGQFGYAIKAYKLIAQQNNSPTLIPA